MATGGSGRRYAQGIVVNNKRLRRLMREHGLQPKRRRRYVVTTDTDHAGPIYPDLDNGRDSAAMWRAARARPLPSDPRGCPR